MLFLLEVGDLCVELNVLVFKQREGLLSREVDDKYRIQEEVAAVRVFKVRNLPLRLDDIALTQAELDRFAVDRTRCATAFDGLVDRPVAYGVPDQPRPLEFHESIDQARICRLDPRGQFDLSAKARKQLRAIDDDSAFPATLRKPAANLRRLLAREKPDAANEFNTTKLMRSPNTWLALPVGYAQFVRTDDDDGLPYRCEEPEEWHQALASAVMGGSAVAPAIPKYEAFPWAASIGKTDPLGFGQIFDDRYFMASSELNLLNTLLLGAMREE